MIGIKKNLTKKNTIFFIIFLSAIAISIYFLFKNSSEEKAMKELNYAQLYFYKGSIDKAFNRKKNQINYLGFLGNFSKYPFTKAGNISKFYAGIFYYKLGDYKESIKIMKTFSPKDEFYLL